MGIITKLNDDMNNIKETIINKQIIISKKTQQQNGDIEDVNVGGEEDTNVINNDDSSTNVTAALRNMNLNFGMHESELLTLRNEDYTIAILRKDLQSMVTALRTPRTHCFAISTFDAHVPFHRFSFSHGGLRMLEVPNAGGHSANSEALSFELIHRLLNIELIKTEMEIHYANSSWKKTDYLCKMLGKKVAVSVTRAVGYPIEHDFKVPQAIALLEKKLTGVCVSSIGAAHSCDGWHRQILHIWCQSRATAVMLQNTFDAVHPRLRGDCLVLCTVAGNHGWIFS